MQSPLNMHQAAVIASRTSLRPSIQHSRSLLGKHCARNIRILHGERPTEATALLQTLNLNKIDPSHRLQQPLRTIPQPKIPQPMAASVIRHPMRIISPHILQPKPLRQKLRKLKYPRHQRLNRSHQPLVFQLRRHLRIVIPNHRHTRRRRHHHRLRPLELLHKPSYQRQSFRLIPCIPMHLSAARLTRGKLHRMPQPFQHPDHGLASLRKQRVVVAGNKQRDSQNTLRNSIEILFPQRNIRQVR